MFNKTSTYKNLSSNYRTNRRIDRTASTQHDNILGLEQNEINKKKIFIYLKTEYELH